MRRIPLRIAVILFGGLFLAGCPYGERRPITASNTEIPRPSASETPIRSIDFNIENIRLGDNEKKVLEILGKPKGRREITVDNCGIAKIRMLEYQGLRVELDQGPNGDWGVLELMITSAVVELEPNILIGDDLEGIRKRRGKGDPERDQNGEQTLFHTTGTNDTAQLEFKTGNLVRIRLFVDPC